MREGEIDVRGDNGDNMLNDTEDYSDNDNNNEI